MNLSRMAGRPLSLAVAAALLINAPLVEAGLFRELSEEALAEMRGKFVVGRHVLYFGMQVSTQWHRPAVPVQAIAVNPGPGDASAAQPTAPADRSAATESQAGVDGRVAAAAAGTSHEVALRFQVDNSGPETRVSYAVGGTLGEPIEDSQIPGGSPALEQIDGAVQAIQVEGSDNGVHNNIGYAVIPAEAAPGLDASQVTEVLPADQSFQNGDMVTHFTTAQGLGFTVSSQGSLVTQRLGMNPVTGNGQLLQAVQLKADGHRIVNDLMLEVAFDSATLQGDGLRFRADHSMNLL